MGYYRKWKPSKSAAAEFKNKMQEINDFCDKYGIIQSHTSDSYYFNINGIDYRVSNHTIEKSNQGAYDQYGNMIRNKYHADQREDNTVYIHASKTRIIEIYNNLAAGYTLDGRGNRKDIK